MLFVFPVSDFAPGVLDRWVNAQRALEPFLDRHLCFVMGGSMTGDIEALERIQAYFHGDPFLRAAYWEKMADLWIKGGFGRQVPLEAVQALEKAAREGYPSAHLYERVGVLRMMRGEPGPARQAFERAGHCPLDLTDSKDLLKSITPKGR
jgi:hypothetical protein